MAEYELIDAPAEGDFAVRLTDDALEPWFKAGETVFLLRSVELRDGDLGLFYSGEGMVFRQYCRDVRGTVYLFAPDRRRKDRDLVIEAEDEMPVCYGKVLLRRPVPLPAD